MNGQRVSHDDSRGSRLRQKDSRTRLGGSSETWAEASLLESRDPMKDDYDQFSLHHSYISLGRMYFLKTSGEFR